MRKRGLILLLTLLALLLCGCSRGGSAAGAGRYPGRSIRVPPGQAQAMDAVYPGSESYLELQENGRGVLCLGGEKTAVRWTLAGTQLTLTAQGKTCRGTLQDGVVTTDYFGTDAELTFGAAGLPLPEEAETLPEAPAQAPAAGTPAEPEPDEPSAADWWQGDWYGWYAVTDASDDLAEWIDQAWDACARITAEGKSGTLSLWDADCAPAERTLTAQVRFSDGLTDAGCMTLKSGTILGCKLTDGIRSVDPAQSEVSRFDHMICIAGSAADSKNPDSWFSFRIYLRPWGMRWDDVADGDVSGCLYTDMMPPGYSSWYLPLLERGLLYAPDSFREAEQLPGEGA